MCMILVNITRYEWDWVGDVGVEPRKLGCISMAERDTRGTRITSQFASALRTFSFVLNSCQRPWQVIALSMISNDTHKHVLWAWVQVGAKTVKLRYSSLPSKVSLSNKVRVFFSFVLWLNHRVWRKGKLSAAQAKAHSYCTCEEDASIIQLNRTLTSL